MSNSTYELPDQNELPPDQVRILNIQAEPWPDKKRIRVLIQLTPFQIRPDLEVSIISPTGEIVSKVNIIENMDQKLVFTMHLRVSQLEDRYQVSTKILYRDIGCVHEKISPIIL